VAVINLLGCDAMTLGKWFPAFRRIMAILSSKVEQSTESGLLNCWRWSLHCFPKLPKWSTKQHNVASPKIL